MGLVCASVSRKMVQEVAVNVYRTGWELPFPLGNGHYFFL